MNVLEEQKGQNRVFQLSGGIYGLYRHALTAHFENLQKDSKCPLTIQMKPVRDKKGMMTDKGEL